MVKKKIFFFLQNQNFIKNQKKKKKLVSQNGGKDFWVFSKGSPEKIKQLCNQKTIPDDYEEVLSYYTMQGFRVLAFGSKKLEIEKPEQAPVSRGVVEKELNFEGFFILENKLKPITSSIIKKLNNASVKSVMVTGDNTLTALSVARECSIVDSDLDAIICDFDIKENNLKLNLVPPILKRRKRKQEKEEKENKEKELFNEQVIPNIKENDFQLKDVLKMNTVELVVSGNCFEFLEKNDQSLFIQLLSKSKIFARMKPMQKTSLIENLKEMNFTVGMCGDGANDWLIFLFFIFYFLFLFIYFLFLFFIFFIFFYF